MRKFLFASVLLLNAGCLFSTGLAAAEDAVPAAIKKTLAEVMPGETAYKISSTPLPGIYEVDFGDGFIYLSADGKYALKGDIIDLHKNTNITEAKRARSRVATLAPIDAENILTFSGGKDAKHSITVFTDIDCGYCRRMHQSIKEYTSRGIDVKYVFYPRSGKNSPSYYKAISVWCADDRNVAMTKAMSGQLVENRTCTNPVDQHMDVAEVLGVTGTPTIFLENGKRLPGFVKAPQLLYIIESQAAGL